MTESAEVVVGGGALGVMCAHHLHERGVDVLLERDGIAEATTTCGAGFIGQWGGGWVRQWGAEEFAYERCGLEFYRALHDADGSFGYRANGTLFITTARGWDEFLVPMADFSAASHMRTGSVPDSRGQEAERPMPAGSGGPHGICGLMATRSAMGTYAVLTLRELSSLHRQRPPALAGLTRTQSHPDVERLPNPRRAPGLRTASLPWLCLQPASSTPLPSRLSTLARPGAEAGSQSAVSVEEMA
jgi:hypothetical protein